ncbi:hypothetical protein [Pectinatus frisingensis]|uniref:hypothetical protein n=1 Tax=Pectinatus frisingensis TaxID=865 RepID=UPI0018C57195|nr:hypothetical protein [Pectinatus frisingensis]
MSTRCPFCGYKLDANNYCQNQKCADYERTKILEAETAKTASNADTSTAAVDSSGTAKTTTNSAATDSTAATENAETASK